MLLRLIKKSFLNQKKAMALMILSVTVGTALAASLITVSLDIRGKVLKELRAFGANILITPKVEGLADISGQKRFLRGKDIVKAKTIFWRHNILGIAPFLESETLARAGDAVKNVDLVGTWYEKELPLPGEKKTFLAGIKAVSPWWSVEGRWPEAEGEVAAGKSIAGNLGITRDDTMYLDQTRFHVTGILETGGKEDGQLFMNMEALQKFKGMGGKVSRILVSALSKPMDDFAYRDPETMSQAEYEKWYCTGYITSIAKQLEEVFPGSSARPIWHVAEAEGKVLGRLEILISILTVIAVAASALGVSTTMIMGLLRRTGEIGIMKSLGADRTKIAVFFLSEGLVTGLIGGLIGYAVSLMTSQYIGIEVFHSAIQQRGILFPISIGSAVCITAIGSILPIARAFQIKPVSAIGGTV